MIRCYLALGSNLNNPLAQVNSAISALHNHPRLQLISYSNWYRSIAQGPGDQPDYINGVACVDTALTPLALLDAIQAIETDHGRVRSQLWGPRTLDIDLLLYGEQTLHSPRLQVPHPRIKDRQFVLQPLFDLAPDLTLPCGASVASWLAPFRAEDLQPATSAQGEA